MALSDKQHKALELLTCGLGYKYSEVAEQVGVAYQTIYRWRNENEEFKRELENINNQRWQAAVDAAMESCASLCREGNQRMVEFVMKNVGYNPTKKIEAEVDSSVSIDINIDNEC